MLVVLLTVTDENIVFVSWNYACHRRNMILSDILGFVYIYNKIKLSYIKSKFIAIRKYLRTNLIGVRTYIICPTDCTLSSFNQDWLKQARINPNT